MARRAYFWKKLKSFDTIQEAKDWYDKYMSKKRRKERY